MKRLKIGPNGGDAPEASQTLDEWISSNRPTVCIEALTEKELSTLHRYYGELAQLSRTSRDLTESHSVEEARSRHSLKEGDRERPAKGM